MQIGKNVWDGDMIFKKLIKIAFACFFATMAIMFAATNTDIPKWVNRIDMWLKMPRVKAFLDTISFAEGTYYKNGYKIMYGYKTFNDFSDHPRSVISAKSNNQALNSSAAGRYQILEKTWDEFSSLMKLRDFSPESQDKVAVALLRDMGALTDVREGRFEHAIKHLPEIWPSLPGSKYRQKVVPLRILKPFYLSRLKYHNKN